MIEPLGYFDIILQSLELLTLIGFLVLFFLERAGYGRDSIGRDSWTTVLLYNILTVGAYGIYWRLKVSYALYSRDRFSAWQWVLLLILVFVLYLTEPKLLLLLTIWDFIIGSRLSRLTGLQTSWFWTFVCGHLYLASFVERSADLLPLDFRAARPERRPRFVTIYCAVVVLAMILTGISYRALVQHRAHEFAKIPSTEVDRTGFWHEIHEKYEKIYSEDKDGHRDVYVLVNNPHFNRLGEWARYTVETKIHDGRLYTYNWFSCVEEYEVVEAAPQVFVTKTKADRSLVESRIGMEKFSVKRGDIMRNSVMARGWEYGQLLKSPWACELAVIKQSWDHALGRLIQKTLDQIPFLEKP